MEQVHGQKGRDWLNEFPNLLLACQRQWSLRLDEPFNNLSFNFVVPGMTADHTQIVLKLGVPCRELSSEAAALRLIDGRGAVRVLGDESSKGAILLERVTPGNPLHKLKGEHEAATIAARVMQSIWRPVQQHSDFVTTEQWFAAFARLRKSFNGGVGPFPPDLISTAERTFTELNATSTERMLLHGDLHHENILHSQSGWVAIDPKGVIGERDYEVGAFLRNQLPTSSTADETARTLTARISVFAAELNLDRARLAKWAFYQTVLSAVWSHEDGRSFSREVDLARVLEGLLPAS
jgi:streptomycin 6-kinase